MVLQLLVLLIPSRGDPGTPTPDEAEEDVMVEGDEDVLSMNLLMKEKLLLVFLFPTLILAAGFSLVRNLSQTSRLRPKVPCVSMRLTYCSSIWQSRRKQGDTMDLRKGLLDPGLLDDDDDEDGDEDDDARISCS